MHSTNTKQFTDFKSERGFTLVEMAVVLVIIGLIIGSVFVGQNLIKTAETRAIISSIEKLNIANNLFKDKFNAIAGDYVKAKTYIDAEKVINGDGNGFLTAVSVVNPAIKPPKDASDQVSAQTNTTAATDYKSVHDAKNVGDPSSTTFNELDSYFNQLSYAGFIDGKYTYDAIVTLDKNFPSLKNGKGGIIAYGSFLDLSNYYHLGLTTSPAGPMNTRNVLTADTAYSIDLKMDDGVPNTGNVIARGGNNLEQAATTSTKLGDATACVINSTGGSTANLPASTTLASQTYNTENTSATTCQLQIKFGS